MTADGCQHEREIPRTQTLERSRVIERGAEAAESGPGLPAIAVEELKHFGESWWHAAALVELRARGEHVPSSVDEAGWQEREPVRSARSGHAGLAPRSRRSTRWFATARTMPPTRIETAEKKRRPPSLPPWCSTTTPSGVARWKNTAPRHDEGRHRPAEAVPEGAGSCGFPTRGELRQPRRERCQQDDGRDQLERADGVAADVGEESADPLAEKARHPRADRAEDVLRVRVQGELVGQRDEEDVERPRRDDPGESGDDPGTFRRRRAVRDGVRFGACLDVGSGRRGRVRCGHREVRVREGRAVRGRGGLRMAAPAGNRTGRRRPEATPGLSWPRCC